MIIYNTNCLLQMKLFECLDPTYVKNPYTGEELLVPCGKCAACRNKHATHWAERLEVERRCWPYCFFVTLTYSDEFVPRYYFKDGCLYDDSDFNVFVADLQSDYNLSNYDYSFLAAAVSITHFDFSHIQNFIKRIRSKISYYDKGKNLRYYCVSEYGPKTYRAHYHLLFFSDSGWFANSHKEIVSSCWSTDSRKSECKSLGRTDSQLVTAGAASYVAGYVSCIADLPDFYHNEVLRPKTLMSRHPAIGSLLVGSDEVRQLFESASPTMFVYSYTKKESVTVPLSRSLRDRLWPKIRGFSENSLDFNIRLYELAEKLDFYDYGTFEAACHTLYEKLYATDLGEYLFKLHESRPSSFVRFYSCLRRVLFQSRVFGVTISHYVRKMVEYYENVQKNSYKEFVKMQDEKISFGVNKKEFLFVDPLKVSRIVEFIKSGRLSDSDRIILNSYGFDSPDVLDYEDLSYDLCSEYLSLSQMHKELHTKALKKRCKNEYESGVVRNTYMYNLINCYYGKS